MELVLVDKKKLKHTLEAKIIHETVVRPVDILQTIDSAPSVTFDIHELSEELVRYLVEEKGIPRLTTKELEDQIVSILARMNDIQ